MKAESKLTQPKIIAIKGRLTNLAKASLILGSDTYYMLGEVERYIARLI